MSGKQMRFAEYEERIIGMPSIVLRYIINDAKEAMEANPDSENNSYYSDEILLCSQELSRRLKPKNRHERSDEFHATLTEMAVNLKNAGYNSGNMIDDLKDLINDSKRPATEEAEGVDYHAKYEELVEAILLWAKTSGDHGGNPYCHSFMKFVPWKDRK